MASRLGQPKSKTGNLRFGRRASSARRYAAKKLKVNPSNLGLNQIVHRRIKALKPDTVLRNKAAAVIKTARKKGIKALYRQPSRGLK